MPSPDAKLHGKQAPSIEFEDRGRVYHLPPALDVADLLDIEKWQFADEVETLGLMRESIGEAEYQSRLDRVKQRYDDGEFSLEHPNNRVLFDKAQAGTRKARNTILSVVRCLFGTQFTKKEIVDLLFRRKEDLLPIISEILEASFDVAPAPAPAGTTEGNREAPGG